MKKIIVGILVSILLTTAITSQGTVFADVTAPRDQLEYGISADKVICKEGYVNAIKKSNNTPICLKPNTAEKLAAKGIVTITATQAMIDEAKNYHEAKPIGTITKLVTVVVPGSSGKLSNKVNIAAYNVAFDICTQKTAILAPEIAVESDSESKSVKLVGLVPSESCQTSVVQIRAANPDTITLELLNKGGLAKKLTALEDRVNTLKAELEKVRSGLSSRLRDSGQSAEVLQSETENIAQIVQLRADLNQARNELNRYLFSLNVIPKFEPKTLDIKKSIAGTPLEGIVVNKLAATPGIQQKDVFDVAFEICSGSSGLRVPIVIVASDVESKAVQLADKIAPNSCQLSGTKIMATTADSINVTSGETAEKSTTVSDLEKQITDLEKKIQDEKSSLKSLVHDPARPANFNEKFIEISENIRDYRVQILELKSKLYRYLSQG
ncbi:MAG: hypothetical protein DWQ18_07705 [Crenarchaeota archaeon]|nr:MAG: hypothetical protein DWQ17_02080 [Thermoproteota archaeon]RDJ33050.1 MAG: hypothetical protein DWQ18_07705 [Thermoproteota archaeon]RDJ35748.1 MAG: hypothetical protein DWQ13_09220 [Thermoproteota archaeon]RDJ36446.1 MAG: hypothetical protein DWQ19_07615 [Thermoproteota archaeon]